MKLNPPARSVLLLALITLSLLHGAESDGVEATLTHDLGTSSRLEAVTDSSRLQDAQHPCETETCIGQLTPKPVTVSTEVLVKEQTSKPEQEDDRAVVSPGRRTEIGHPSVDEPPRLHAKAPAVETQKHLSTNSECEQCDHALAVNTAVGNDGAAIEQPADTAIQEDATSGTVEVAHSSPAEKNSNASVIDPTDAIALPSNVQPPSESIQPAPGSEPAKTETILKTETAISEEPASETADRLINLAAAADGASVVAANKEARKPEKTIDGDHDSYMKNHCPAHKWIIIELSQLGRVDEVQLVNKEMYSSRVREFSIRGRQSHPRKDGPQSDWPRFFDADSSWQLLGNYTAQNKKGEQTFKIQQPSRVRYLLLQLHTHYGAEEMCALNSISVMGISAAQELEEALSRHIAPPAVTERLNSQKPPVTEPSRTAATQVQAGVDSTTAAKNGSIQATELNVKEDQQDNQLVKPGKSVSDKQANKHSDSDNPNPNPDYVIPHTEEGSLTDQAKQKKPDTGEYDANSLVSEVPAEREVPMQSTAANQLPASADLHGSGADASLREERDGEKPDGQKHVDHDSGAHDSVDSHYLPEPWMNYEYTDEATIADLESRLASNTKAVEDLEPTQSTGKPAAVDGEHIAESSNGPDVSEGWMTLPIQVNTNPNPADSVGAGQTKNSSGSEAVKTNTRPAHSMSDIQQSKIVLLPPPESTVPLLIDSPLLAAMEGGPAAKPRQAGNLFDIFKQEFVFLRLNQTHVWQYITTIVDVLNKNAAAMAEEVARLKQQVETQQQEQSITDNTKVGEAVLTEITDYYSSHIEELRQEMASLRKQVEQARQREVALLMYISTALSLMFGFLALRPGAGKGQAVLDSLFPRLVMLIGILNGFIGVVLQNPSLQQFLLALIQQHLGMLHP